MGDSGMHSLLPPSRVERSIMLTVKNMAGHLTKVKQCSVEIEDTVTWHHWRGFKLKKTECCEASSQRRSASELASLLTRPFRTNSGSGCCSTASAFA